MKRKRWKIYEVRCRRCRRVNVVKLPVPYGVTVTMTIYEATALFCAGDDFAKKYGSGAARRATNKLAIAIKGAT